MGWRNKFLVACGSCLGTLLVLETGFDVWSAARGVGREDLERYRQFVSQGLSMFEPRPHTVYARRRSTSATNSLGFMDHEWRLEKEPGTVRILCLGGSTTESGNSSGNRGSYPFLLQQVLEQEYGRAAEVMNGGMSGWTSAESLVAWFLTLQDFAPDVVIVHDGINDVPPRTMPGFRPDYTHWRHSWSGPPRFGPLHRFLVAHSDLYASLVMRDVPGITQATSYPTTSRVIGADGSLPPETARAFARNVRTVAEHAALRGARVVLLTMPLRSTKNGLWEQTLGFCNRQHNQILRELAAANDWLLVDAERYFGEHLELDGEFLDTGHLKPRGNQAKAELVAEALARDWPAPR